MATSTVDRTRFVVPDLWARVLEAAKLPADERLEALRNDDPGWVTMAPAPARH